MKGRSISGSTVVYGIIGDPIEHSMSPAMHNAAFQKLGMNAVYIPFRVKEERLPLAINGIRALNIKGFNVTIPHKIAIMALLDEIDPLATKIGSVNTVVNRDGKLTGYNTDSGGFIRALLCENISLKDKTVVVLGAGGAAISACFALANHNCNIIIINRTLSQAKLWADKIYINTNILPVVLPLNNDSLSSALKRADILINATSVGMWPDTDSTLVTAEYMHPGLIVYDLVYNPLETRLLKEARKAGAKCISGMEMLLYQGIEAFELLTGRKAPEKTMRNALARELSYHEI